MKTDKLVYFLLLGALFTIGTVIDFADPEPDELTFLAAMVGILFIYYWCSLQQKGDSNT